MSEIDFAVVIPAKPPSRGKSRLVGIPDEHRQALARAFLLDTVAAAAATPGVRAILVVTDDYQLAATLRGTCEVIPDGVSGDLNETLRLAALDAERRWPGTRPVALCADLPSLTAEDLGTALADVAVHAPEVAAFVTDRLGTGTTLYTAPVEIFRPGFGFDSARRHRNAGAVELAAGPSLTHDVDDMADLGRAMVLGLGPETARASGRA